MQLYREPGFFGKVIRRIRYGKYLKWPRTLWHEYVTKFSAYHRVRAKALRGEKLNVVFFVLNISMWKYESLVRLMLADGRFNPVLVPYPTLFESNDVLKANAKGIEEYCRRMGFPFRRGYDPDTGRYVTPGELDADFVSYSQPYNNGAHFYRVEQFYPTALIFSYPYGLSIDNNSHFNNLLVENVSWRLFHTSESVRGNYASNPVTRGRNFKCVGISIYDKLCGVTAPTQGNELKTKKVIWAPHHTIGDNDDLPFSTFLTVCDDMIDIAREYNGRLEFVFKPHPMLRDRLVALWGEERTREYYAEWERMENTSVCTGDYTELFRSSDAMIHDCGGFTMEYLFTHKPVMFMLKKPDIRPYVSDFSYQCFRQHYTGRTAGDIRRFLDSTVIGGNDPMAAQREEFYRENLLPPGGRSVAQNMLEEFTSLFNA